MWKTCWKTRCDILYFRISSQGTSNRQDQHKDHSSNHHYYFLQAVAGYKLAGEGAVGFPEEDIHLGRLAEVVGEGTIVHRAFSKRRNQVANCGTNRHDILT